jgi:hypothetical protein
MNNSNANTTNEFSIDSELGENNFIFSDIQAKKQNLTNSNTNNTAKKEQSTKLSTVSQPAPLTEITTSTDTTMQANEKANNYGWIVPTLAGVGCTLVFQKIKEEFFTPKPTPQVSESLAGQYEARKKSRVVESEKEKRMHRYKDDDYSESEIRQKQTKINTQIMIDENKYSEWEYINIPQDLIISVVQMCNEASLKLLLHNASERKGTMRAQMLYEYKNNYARNAIAEIQKTVKDFSEYYYFIPAQP